MSDDRAIVITGASTGIGKACALRLDNMGFRVFAGVRRSADGAALQRQASEKLTPLILDVTEADSIAAAAGIVAEAAGGELFGLVNNAGISGSGPLELTPMAETRRVMETNVIGLLAVTQALLPLLRRGRGRIVNMGSAAGLSASPGVSNYASSKFAVQAITDSLRVELRPFGMWVTIVAPGAVESPIWEKSAARQKEALKTAQENVVLLYAPLFEFFRRIVKSRRKASAEQVAEAVAHALTSRRPKYRYLVGRDAKAMAKIARLPHRLRDWLMFKLIYKHS
ncbi:MAG: SDR family oxidoreductase [bacterium]|nr:SDR family oxidoreductase [bacterium]